MNLLERYLLSREMGCHGKSLLSTFPAFMRAAAAPASNEFSQWDLRE